MSANQSRRQGITNPYRTGTKSHRAIEEEYQAKRREFAVSSDWHKDPELLVSAVTIVQGTYRNAGNTYKHQLAMIVSTWPKQTRTRLLSLISLKKNEAARQLILAYLEGKA